ncbi:MAG: hypothetical protein HYR63_01905 [Proteobacteria bacterium]|nr:hypothetical protein [Pseudomonadota bacterium]
MIHFVTLVGGFLAAHRALIAPNCVEKRDEAMARRWGRWSMWLYLPPL